MVNKGPPGPVIDTRGFRMQQLTAPGEQVNAPTKRTLWVIGGVLAFASLAAAAALALRSLPAPADARPASLETPADPSPTAKTGTPVPALSAPVHSAAAPVREHRSTPPASPSTQVAQAPVCKQCGVIESVQAVKRKGAGTGVGAVTGGVLGAVLGNQVGKGNGRSAMTVLGAVGGGFAGNEVEKRARAETVYEVRVRMDDGALHTVEQRQAPRIGERVEVQGQTLKGLPG
jgi:outer membrane lipoprotein SlyB